jgi:hypothetical protein
LDVGTTEFFLLSENDPDAQLDEGRPVKLEELFPEGLINSQTVQAQT